MEALTCTKKVFPTKALAKKFAKELNRSGKSKKKITNIYYCNQCSGYHMTSMNKKRSRRMNKKVKK